jgi:hypothetical protein
MGRHNLPPSPFPPSTWPKYTIPPSTLTALAARGVSTQQSQQQQRVQPQPRGGHGPGPGPASTSKTSNIGHRQHSSPLPPRPLQAAPAPPPKPTELPIAQLQRDPRYRAMSSRWTRAMVALPIAIVSSYFLWERCEFPSSTPLPSTVYIVFFPQRCPVLYHITSFPFVCVSVC